MGFERLWGFGVLRGLRGLRASLQYVRCFPELNPQSRKPSRTLNSDIGKLRKA